MTLLPGAITLRAGGVEGADAGEIPVDTVLDGRYRVGPVVRSGALGVSYVALDETLGRRVTVVELHQGHEGSAEAARRLARVQHPNVVRVLAVLDAPAVGADAVERGPIVVLERLRGESLGSELRHRRGAFSQAEVGDILGQVAAAARVITDVVGVSPTLAPDDVVRTDDGRIVVADLGLGGAERPGGVAGLAQELLTGRPPGPDSAPAWRVNPTVSRGVSDALAVALGADATGSSTEALLRALGTAAAPGAWPEATVDAREPEPDPTAALAASPPTLAPTQAQPDLRPTPGRAPSGVGPAASTVTPTVLDPVAAAPRATIPAPGGFVAAVPDALRAPRPGPDLARRGPEPRPLADATVPRGRPWVTVPLGFAVVALTSVAPVAMTALLGLVVAPVLATVGDVVAHGARRSGWAPLWALRNLAVAAIRVLPAGVVLLVGALLWWGTGAFDGMDTAGTVILRVTGIVTGWVLALSISRGGPGFRSHLALDEATRRLLPGGRPNLAYAPFAVAAACCVLAGLWFTPEAWPIGG